MTGLTQRIGRIALVLVVGTSVALVGAPNASAAPAVLDKPTPLTNPASVITSIVGNLAPEASAARAAGFALEKGFNGAINTGTIGTGISIANWVPGFKLGYKAGEWISQGLGLYNPLPSQPPETFIPYEGLVGGDAGFQDGNTVITEYRRDGAGQILGTADYVCAANAAYVAGQILTLDQMFAPGGSIIQCQGAPNTSGASGNFDFAEYRLDGTLAQTGTTGGSYPFFGADGHYFDLYPAAKYDAQGNRIGWEVPGALVVCGGADGQCSIGQADATFVYRFVGNPDRAPDVAPTPLRQLRTTTTCAVPGGQPAINGYYWTGLFHETDAQFPAAPAATCSAGQLVGSSLDLVDGEAGAGMTVISNISTWTAPTTYTDWLDANPECWNGQCGVLLEQISADGTAVSCFDNSVGCEHWFDDPAKDSKFRCTQNGKTLALSECNAYSPTFDPAKLNLGIAYGDPATGLSPQPSTSPMDSSPRQPLGVTVDQAVAIETGTTPNPNPNPTPTTGAGFPTGGTNTAPAGVDTEGASCMGEAWSWNPLNWVFVPVKCVLQWAFVPSAEEVAGALGPMRDAWNSSAPGQYANGIGAKFTSMIPVGADGDCLGPALTIDSELSGTKTMYPLSTCDDPVRSVAAMVKLILTALVWFGIAIACQAMILPAFGFKPLLQRGESVDVLQ